MGAPARASVSALMSSRATPAASVPGPMAVASTLEAVLGTSGAAAASGWVGPRLSLVGLVSWAAVGALVEEPRAGWLASTEGLGLIGEESDMTKRRGV